jgi:putative spermidine/putrescine transport system permease protein
MPRTRTAFLLLAPAGFVFLVFFLLPVAELFLESVKLFVPGRVGSVEDAPFSLNNYGELLSRAFGGVLLETFRISAGASLVALIAAFPLAYLMVRVFGKGLRTAAIGLLIALMFLSVLVRTYALELTFGAVGPAREILLALGISPSSRTYIEFMVGAGLLHYAIPISALTLLGTVQNIDPRLTEAAQSLGAPAWRAHMTVTLPLSGRGLVAAFLFSFTFSISAFVIPMILGRGRVLFVSNLIYNRFSEIANYPSGAAISIVMFLLSLMTVYLISRLAEQRWELGR